MKILKAGLSLALLGTGVAFVPSASSAAPVTPTQANGDGSSLTQIEQTAQGQVTGAVDRGTGGLGSVRATGAGADLLPDVAGDSAGQATAKVEAYLDRYATAFGAPAGQLRQVGARATDVGWTVDYTQVYDGVEVFGSRLRAHVDSEGDLTSVNGFTVPDLALDTTPALGAAQAADRAVAVVRSTPPRSDGAAAATSGLEAAATDLVVYKMGSPRGVAGPAVLAYAVEVTNRATVRDMVFLDARTGKTVNRYSMMAEALDRELYEESATTAPVWQEGDAFPGTLDQDQQNEVSGTGEAYWLFANTFGRDSYDGEGATMRTVNNDPSISCPNANWNGETTNYCSGVSSDDTVAHEWGHAYTEYTSGLVYQWQPGAMNEAYSDIWGETVDMVNDRFNETPDTRRTEGACSTYTRGDIAVAITAPAGVAGDCDAEAAQFGPVFGETPTTAQVVVGRDADADGADTADSPTDGCSAYTNGAAVTGRWVYVDRGACTLSAKADVADAAGATGIVIGQNTDDAPFSISGTADIYGVMVDRASGARFKAAGAGDAPVTVSVQDATSAPKDDSYRWLSGEADPAFGGAIRDMWNPTCYGDPGKVSDMEYFCSTDDSGGVHSNSGVVNHAYALTVDGGTYSGVTVAGLGLDKAAAIYWRTQSEYLFPVADFADLADGLQASCTDLVGEQINQVSVTPDDAQPSAETITAADCDSVAAIADAVELRREPVQCDFGPLLAKDAPATCGKGTRTAVTYRETFEDGLAGWTAGERVVYPGASGVPWTTATGAALPAGHGGRAAYGPDPIKGGSCDGSAADLSSANSITSPVITVPKGKTPRMSFTHYVATEVGYDGGNVKASVDGGPFAVVPPAAYLYNAPGGELDPEPDNTSPLAGEPGFTGTDGGEPTGSWGTSRIDLRKLAKPGQKVRVRFDMGRDGCGGLDGWYVDDVTVSVCKVLTRTVAVPRPGKPARVGVRVKRRLGGAKATGPVKLVRQGTVLDTAVLRAGKATLVVPPRFEGPRKYRFVVRFPGNSIFRKSTDGVRVRVTR